MNKLLLVIVIFGIDASANEYVRGYTRHNGTYVAPHYRTSPDSPRDNNWSTTGNVNPYTGSVGTHQNDFQYRQNHPLQIQPYSYGNDN